MSDDLKIRVDEFVSRISAPERPALRVIEEGARRKRWQRRLAVASVSVAVLVFVWAAALYVGRAGNDPSVRVADGVQARGTLADQAAVFAVRALAADGLLDPLGRYYAFTENVVARDGTWTVGFGASRCFRTEELETCRALSGKDELGNAKEDAWVSVRLKDTTWRVVGARGNFVDDARERLLHYSLPQQRESPHWEYPTVRVDQPLTQGGLAETGGLEVRASDLWVGPIPSNAPGSRCQLRAFNDSGDVVYEDTPFYVPAARQEWERSGGLRGSGIPEGIDATGAEIECRTFHGRGWQPVGQPKLLVANDNKDVYVTAELKWVGEPLVLAESHCRATVLDSEESVIGEGSTSVSGLWPPSRIERDPLPHEKVTIDIRPDAHDAVDVGQVECSVR